MKHDGKTVLELVDFIVSTFNVYKNKERKVESFIRKTLEYGVGDYGVDENGIVYVVRWNIDESGLEAQVIDLIIREDRRGDIKLIKYIIGRNWMKFPHVKLISFVRHAKYPYSRMRSYKLESFFKQGG